MSIENDSSCQIEIMCSVTSMDDNWTYSFLHIFIIGCMDYHRGCWVIDHPAVVTVIS